MSPPPTLIHVLALLSLSSFSFGQDKKSINYVLLVDSLIEKEGDLLPIVKTSFGKVLLVDGAFVKTVAIMPSDLPTFRRIFRPGRIYKLSFGPNQSGLFQYSVVPRKKRPRDERGKPVKGVFLQGSPPGNGRKIPKTALEMFLKRERKILADYATNPCFFMPVEKQ